MTFKVITSRKEVGGSEDKEKNNGEVREEKELRDGRVDMGNREQLKRVKGT